MFAAYGDLLYAWNATDATKGVSITPMPYEKKDLQDCKYYYPPYYPMEEPVMVEPAFIGVETTDAVEVVDGEETSEPVPAVEEKVAFQEGVRNRHRRESVMWIDPCYQPKPRIVSLLLEGERLTAIVSEENSRYWYHPETTTTTTTDDEPVISDHTKLTARVYDISTVPTDRSPLTLVFEEEIKGNFDSARSVDDTAFVLTTMNVQTHLFTQDLSRYHTRYCGLNDTEYKELAAEVALNKTVPFTERMVEDLQLQLGGQCDSIFQVAAMQSGDSKEDATSGDMLGQFVQILSFDMSSSSFAPKVAGGFSSGYVHSFYASEKFAAAMNVGSTHDANTGEWVQSTFVLGFDISTSQPKPIAVGEVRGTPKDQYSVDFHEGHLRVVTTEWMWGRWDADFTGSRTLNKINILQVPTGGGTRMEVVGQTGHIGKPNEDVRSVR